MTSDMEKWNDKIQWVRNGFLHGKDFDKAQPIPDDFDLSDENLLQVLTCLDTFCYFNIVSDCVKTKVFKAKILGKWSECCESIKIHRINENRIFAGFIKDWDCLTDGEKDQILN